MTDTAPVQTYTWEDERFKSAEDANTQFYLPPQGDYILRIDNLTEPKLSTRQWPDPKDPTKLQPARIQTQITFTIVDGDDPKAIGQKLKSYFTVSLNQKANFYKLVKKVFGGDVDPRWKPNPDDLLGKIIKADIGHKPPNAMGFVYPKIEGYSIYRGTNTYADVQASTDLVTDDDDDGDAVPF